MVTCFKTYRDARLFMIYHTAILSREVSETPVGLLNSLFKTDLSGVSLRNRANEMYMQGLAFEGIVYLAYVGTRTGPDNYALAILSKL